MDAVWLRLCSRRSYGQSSSGVVVRWMLMVCRLTFVATTALAAMHARATPRGNTAPPANMAAV
jgi:hypothetical protein